MILYLHGFLSSPASAKAVQLGARAAERGIPFACPKLPIDPAAALQIAADLIQNASTPVTLVGSSLGGHYATWLAERHGLKAVLVNPSVLAHLSLERYLGPQANSHSGETNEFTRDHIAALRATQVEKITRPERYWLLVETGDEVLDYRQAVARYAGVRQDVLEGGDHSFTRWQEFIDPVLDFATGS